MAVYLFTPRSLVCKFYDSERSYIVLQTEVLVEISIFLNGGISFFNDNTARTS